MTDIVRHFWDTVFEKIGSLFDWEFSVGELRDEDCIRVEKPEISEKELDDMIDESVRDMKMCELVDDMRRTLIARIIPSLPVSPNINDGRDRDRTRKQINRFEFRWYLEEARKAWHDQEKRHTPTENR